MGDFGACKKFWKTDKLQVFSPINDKILKNQMHHFQQQDSRIRSLTLCILPTTSASTQLPSVLQPHPVGASSMAGSEQNATNQVVSEGQQVQAVSGNGSQQPSANGSNATASNNTLDDILDAIK